MFLKTKTLLILAIHNPRMLIIATVLLLTAYRHLHLTHCNRVLLELRTIMTSKISRFSPLFMLYILICIKQNMAAHYSTLYFDPRTHQVTCICHLYIRYYTELLLSKNIISLQYFASILQQNHPIKVPPVWNLAGICKFRAPSEFACTAIEETYIHINQLL